MNPIRKQFGSINTRPPVTGPPSDAVQAATGGPQRSSGASSGLTVAGPGTTGADRDPMQPINSGSPFQNVLKRKIGVPPQRGTGNTRKFG